MNDIKPSEIDLSYPHFIACCGRSEREAALGLYVRACQVKGDTWQPMIPRDIGEVLKADVEANRPPYSKLTSNPFWRPDFHGLAEAGFARWTENAGSGSPVELTDEGFLAVKKWVDRVGRVKDSATPHEAP